MCRPNTWYLIHHIIVTIDDSLVNEAKSLIKRKKNRSTGLFIVLCCSSTADLHWLSGKNNLPSLLRSDVQCLNRMGLTVLIWNISNLQYQIRLSVWTIDYLIIWMLSVHGVWCPRQQKVHSELFVVFCFSRNIKQVRLLYNLEHVTMNTKFRMW